MENYNPDNNISSRILSIYEKTSILGLRLSQLSYGAKTVLSPQELENCKSVKDIVLKEYETKKIPLMIKRVLPNDAIEYWKIQDMITV